MHPWLALVVQTLASAVPTPAPQPDTVHLVLVATTDSVLLRVLAIADFHGQLTPRVWDWSRGRAVGGAPALKSWLDSLARACGCATVRVDAGDQFQGTPLSNFTYGRRTVQALSAMGLDAAAIGNHEFDWSVDTLRARMREARYQFVSANITDALTGGRPSWVRPWTLVERDGLKVAVIGLTTTSTPTTTAPRHVRGLSFGDPGAAVRSVLPEARAAADFVLVVAHEGAVCDSTACAGPILELARALDSASVDLIVAGHSHRLVNTVMNGIPVVEAGSSGGAIAVVDFVRVDGRRETRARIETPYTDAVRSDPALADELARAQRAADSVTSRPVRRLRFALRRDGPEHGLGRLIADAQRAAARADVAIMNNGGIRTDLPGGVVTYGDLYQVQPFQNRLQKLTVRGDVLLAALEHAVADGRGPPDAHVSGVEVWYDPGRPPGRRITRTRLPGGREIEQGRAYTLAVSDFLATGGSGFAMLRDAPAEDVGVIDLDALIQYLRVLREPVDAPADIRWHRTGGGGL